MSSIIRSHKDDGPYYNDTRHNYISDSVVSFITNIRSCFENQDDAILVEQDGKATGLWLREPDVDCDSDGFFEVGGRFPGDEYVLYRPTYGGFWNYVGHHFGHQHVPIEHSFITQRHPKIASWH